MLDILDEAARHARTEPAEAARLATLAETELVTVSMADRCGLGEYRTYRRLATNLFVGVALIQADPEVLIGYCRGARLEVQDMERRRERREDAAKGGES